MNFLKNIELESFVNSIVTYSEQEAVKAYAQRQRTPNFWSIIEYGRNSYETRYSKMLRWLLDPNESHNLGSQFSKDLLNILNIKPKKIDADTSSNSLKGCDTEALSSHVDVFFYDESNSTIITIELKMGSKDHAAGTTEVSQLDKYYEAVDNSQVYSREKFKNRYFFYVTIQGEDPTLNAKSSDHWKNVSFHQVAEAANLFLQKVENQHTFKIVEDFIVDLNRQVDVAGNALGKAAIPFAENFREIIDNLARHIDSESGLAERKNNAELFEKVSRLANERGIDSSNFRDYIQTIDKSIAIGAQDHTPYEGSQKLAEAIYEKLTGVEGDTSGREDLSLGEFKHLTHFVRRTRSPGQGVRLLNTLENPVGYGLICLQLTRNGDVQIFGEVFISAPDRKKRFISRIPRNVAEWGYDNEIGQIQKTTFEKAFQDYVETSAEVIKEFHNELNQQSR